MKVSFDLNTGLANVTVQADMIPKPADLWQAIERSGFTPTRIEYDGESYEGPEP